MKIILTKDYPKLGQRYEVKKVASGFARNFLIPQKIAVLATPIELKKLKHVTARISANTKRTAEDIQTAIAKLTGKSLTLKRKASDGGKLFAAITAKDIAKALKEEFSVVVSEKDLPDFAPLKNTGEYEVVLRLAADAESRVKIIVEKE